MKEELLHIKKELSKKLKKERFEHTVGVMYTSASLAMRYGANIEKAMTAGLLHDCGKYCSAKEQLKLCEKYKITLTDLEHSMPALIHAKLGAYLAENEYGIKDREVLDAITYHTTGRPEMTMLEKILYIADYIDGIITREQFWSLARFKYPTHQINFCSSESLKCLTFVSGEEVVK